MDAKQYLDNVREAMFREAALTERYEQVTAALDGVGAIQYDDMPKNPNTSSDGIHNRVVRYNAIKKKLDEQKAFTDMLIDQAWAMLETMREDGVPQALVDEAELYYMWGYDNYSISKQLKPHRAVSTIKHRRAQFLKIANGYLPLDAA